MLLDWRFRQDGMVRWTGHDRHVRPASFRPERYAKVSRILFRTQELDDTGKMRTVVRDAQWSSSVSHLHYWSRENDKPGAGPGGHGSGSIAAPDLQVSVT